MRKEAGSTHFRPSLAIHRDKLQTLNGWVKSVTIQTQHVKDEIGIEAATELPLLDR